MINIEKTSESKHICFRVYLNGDRSAPLTLNSEEKTDWCRYNQTMRFGCAQFVDNQCVYPGYLNEEQIKAVKFKS